MLCCKHAAGLEREGETTCAVIRIPFAGAYTACRVYLQKAHSIRYTRLDNWAKLRSSARRARGRARQPTQVTAALDALSRDTAAGHLSPAELNHAHLE